MEVITPIDHLGSNNYATWAEDMKVILMKENCWRLVTGTEVKPEDTATKQLSNFLQRSDKAYSLIYLNIEKDYRCLITDIEDPRLAWSRLLEHFRPDSRARIIGLTDEFFSCRITDGEEIGIYAARLKKTSQQLKDAGKPIPEWYQNFQLIRFLPHQYNGIVQIIYRWTEDEFKFDKILQELLAEESRLKQSQKDHEVIALLSGKQKQSSKPELKQENKICYRCSKPGHTSKQCRQPSKKNLKDRIPRPESSFIVESSFSEGNSNLSWVFDTAASAHFCSNKNLLTDFKRVTDTTMAVAISGVNCPVEGTGNVKLSFRSSNGECQIVNLLNVIYTPKLRRNLISGPLIDKGGGSFIGKKNKIMVYAKEGHKLFTCKKVNGLYYVNPDYPKLKNKNALHVDTQNPKSFKDNLSNWHNKYCHINKKYIIKTCKENAVNGLPSLKDDNVNCEDCKIAKSRRKTFKSIGKIRSEKPLELLHMDLAGPLPTVAIGGYRYIFSIIDDYSRKVTVFPIKDKTEVFRCFTNYQKRAERFLNSKIINVRTDNGLEFINKEFEKFLEDQGIRAERTNTYTPEQNGVAERYNYTALDGIKVLLKSSGLDDKFWAEALLCLTYVWNRICQSKQNVTPFELYGGRKPSVKHFKVFGTQAYLGVPKQLRRKLDMRAKKGIMVGYALRTRGYRIWLPQEHKIVESINVSFDEEPKRSGLELEALPKISIPKIYKSDSPETDSDSEESEEEPDQMETSTGQASRPDKITWIREAKPRKDKSRVDIYYKIQGSNARLRSNNDVENYCKAHNIAYDKNLFNFSGKNSYSGIVALPESNLSKL